MRKAEAVITLNLQVVGAKSAEVQVPDWAQAVTVFPVGVNYAGAAIARVDGAPEQGWFATLGITLSNDNPQRDALSTDIRRLRLETTTAHASADHAAEFRVVLTDAQATK